MSIRLHVEVCKKEGTANYGSIGATCGLEVEIDLATLADPTAAVARIRGFYSLCELAINEELARLKIPAAASAAPPTEGTAAAAPTTPPPAKRPADRTPAIPPPTVVNAEHYDHVDEVPEDDDPPTDGKHLLGWARNQPGDAKNWLVGLGKRLRYPNRILDWSPKQVQTAYQTYREAQRG
jgi:hypothetical protein